MDAHTTATPPSTLRPRRPASIAAPARLVGDRIVRFSDPFSARGPARPSFSLLRQWDDAGDGSESTSLRVLWRASRRRGRPRRSFTIDLEPGTDLYGMGEHAGCLRRNGRRITLWNADHYAYDDRTPSLYQSHPWILGVRPDGSSFGVLWDTACRSRAFASDRRIIVHAEDADFPVYVVERQTPAQVVVALTDLVGRISLPPLWALGYQQSRYSYYPDSEVRRIADQMRLRRIPCDVIWLDIHYMDGNRSFTFDPDRFPDPASLLAHLHERSLRAVLMIDPGLKVDPAYHAYASGHERGVFVRDAVGAEYHGQVWPGACAFPDFASARVREWWGSLYEPLIRLGADGFWNDMNEPAIFDGPGRTMPEGNVHDADPELGGPTTHARIHNVYGTLMVRATREGVQKLRPEKRPFILTRSSFLGGHRFAATWTGDNSSTWEHLGWSITMALNLGLSGQPIVGPDIGGFEGNATGQLFARWMGIGAMLPFCRAHTDVWTREHEPWSWGPLVEATCRRAIVRRYRLLPLWYTLMHEACRTGLPAIRPLFFADPEDPALRNVDDAFLVGDSVLVRCRVTPDGACEAPLPSGPWAPFDLVEEHDPELPTLHLRAGSIIPVAPTMQHTAERSLDPLTLLVHLDSHGRAAGSLYEDAGEGHGHARGEYRLTHLEATTKGRTLRIRTHIVEGDMPQVPRAIIVRVLTPDAAETLHQFQSDGSRDQTWELPLA